jgi:hypothetical protein
VYHRLWIFLNGLLVLASIVYIWIIRPHDSSLVVAAQLLAQIGMILFLVNINMYFIFLVIRKSSIRKVKVRLAKFSRYMMKWHIPIAVLGTSVIIGHGAVNLYAIAPLIGYSHLKILSGMLAMGTLAVTLFAGWLRHNKSSGFRRKFHLTAAMTFLVAFLVHMFMPV